MRVICFNSVKLTESNGINRLYLNFYSNKYYSVHIVVAIQFEDHLVKAIGIFYETEKKVGILILQNIFNNKILTSKALTTLDKFY